MKKIVCTFIFLCFVLLSTFANAIFSVEKTAYEEFYYYVNFTNWIQVGETLTGTPSVTSIDRLSGIDVSTDMISNVAIDSNVKVKFKLKGGVTGRKYNLKVKTETNAGQKFEYKSIVIDVN